MFPWVFYVEKMALVWLQGWPHLGFLYVVSHLGSGILGNCDVIRLPF